MVATTNTTRECCCARSAWCVVASRRCMNGANKSSSPDRLRNCQTTLVSQATHVIAFRDSSRARVSQYSNRQGVVEGLQWPNSSGETDPFSSCRGRFRPRRLRCGGWRRLMFYGLLPRAARAVGRLVAQYRGPASGPSGNKNGPFLGQLVKNNDRKYAFRKPFENFGKIRIFLRFRIRGQTGS